MSEYTLDDLYGCSLEEYCEALGTSVDELLDQKWKEVDLLQANYDRLIEKRKDMSIALMMKEINSKIHSKRKMIARFEKWARTKTSGS